MWEKILIEGVLHRQSHSIPLNSLLWNLINVVVFYQTKTSPWLPTYNLFPVSIYQNQHPITIHRDVLQTANHPAWYRSTKCWNMHGGPIKLPEFDQPQNAH